MRFTTFCCCLLLFLFCNQLGTAQEKHELAPCGTLAKKDAWLTHYQLNKSQYSTESDSSYLVPISVHILGSDEGNGYFSIKKLMTAFCQLNEDYEASNIQFYIKDDIHYLNASKWYDHEDILTGAEMMFAENIENTINCYIVANPARNCGYNLPYAGIALSKGCTGKGDHTWAHEMGHNLSLPHPFLGWEGDEYNYNVTTPKTVTYDYTLFKDSLILDTTIIDTALVESVERTNCLLAADGFCDTRPDYISRRWICNEDNESPAKFKDFNEVDFKVDGTLFMSYANDACQNRFSSDQIDAMRATLIHQKPELIKNSPVIPAPLTLDYKLNYPIEEEFVPYDDVEINWNKIEGADKYYIEISRKDRFSRIVYSHTTTDNTITVNSLLKNKTYYWRIYAYGPYHYCSEVSDIAIFKTNEVSNTDNKIKGLNHFALNWTEVGELNLMISSSHNKDLALKIVNVYGQIILQSKLRLIEGLNELSISKSINWTSGSYYIILEDRNRNRQSKITIKR